MNSTLVRWFAALVLSVVLPGFSSAQEKPLRIVCFGAHPDDAELRNAGVAALWAAAGHKVKFVSVTNGDIGHWREAGGPLAQRRKAEVEAAARVLGIETQVLDIHDGELEPTLEHRRTITRIIRNWNADLVICHSPSDYHPDHRNVAVLVQDSAYMVTVPFFCPDTPALKRNPVFMYCPVSPRLGVEFRPDIVVDIDSVKEAKAKALATLESQFYEGGANGGEWCVPADPAKQQERRAQVARSLAARDFNLANQCRAKLIEIYGKEKGEKIQNAEAFALCPFGRTVTKEELMKMFMVKVEGK